MSRLSTRNIKSAFVLSILLSLLLIPKMAFPYNWLQFNGDPRHSGNNTLEKEITKENVGGLGKLFSARLPAAADGAPVYLGGVKTPKGRTDLLFVTTTAGHIIALNARTGAYVWQRRNPAGKCRINRGSKPCYTTSSPAIDPDLKYVYSYGLEAGHTNTGLKTGPRSLAGAGLKRPRLSLTTRKAHRHCPLPRQGRAQAISTLPTQDTSATGATTRAT